MPDQRTADPGKHAPRIIAWFILDAVVALAPPLYWAVDGNRASVLGVPVVVVYFISVALFITASIVAAYLLEAREKEGN